MVENTNDYNADSIDAMTPRNHLLSRMSLTFGPIGDPFYEYSAQKTVAIREILDNATDEIRGGFGTHVRVHMYEDGCVEIQDSGRGIPTDVNHKTRESGIYMAMGRIQSGGKFSAKKSYSSGLNGVGGSSSVCVSRRADIIVFRNGKKYELSFKDFEPGFFKGEGMNAPFTSLQEMGKDKSYLRVSKDTRKAAEKQNYETGTIVRLWLDDDAFVEKKPFDDNDIIDRVKYTAYLVPQLTVEVTDDKKKDDAGNSYHETFHYPDGITSLCDYLAPSMNRLTGIQLVETVGHYTEEAPVLDKKTDTVNIQAVQRDVPIQVAFCWNTDEKYRMNSFVNTIHTKLGGVHVKAFEQAMVSAFNGRIETMRGKIQKDHTPPIIDDYRLGLTVILSVQQTEPMFSSQSKEELSGSENQKAIKNALIDAFNEFIASSKNKQVVDAICNKVAEESRIRQSEKAARDAQRKANAALRSTVMPAKLVDCKYINDDKSELHICEGDSALGGLKSARDARYQALLPIRGKIINAYKATPDALMANEEVQSIITCLGAGIGDDFDLDKMRYGRVVISTDGDSDGYAIQCLLLVLFYSLFRKVIEAGRLYVTYPPLFEVSVRGGKETLYALDRSELNEVEAGLKKRGVSYGIIRDKGLGGMEPEDARVTLMNPETRVMKQITMNDIEPAERILELALGKDSKTRQQWISDNFDDISEDAMDF